MVVKGYPFNWALIAQEVKDRARWNCQTCGHHHDPGHGYTLTTHHIDGNPQNCAFWNLVALCQRCHLHFQSLLIPGQLFLLDPPLWYIKYLDALQSTREPLKLKS